ncbi:hypothetical protein HanIR_Chr14g0712371 [Helianthus annuus]|nr:hypothetical protein HanIR_Chr14g0712371 [Helianthus annuus]
MNKNEFSYSLSLLLSIILVLYVNSYTLVASMSLFHNTLSARDSKHGILIIHIQVVIKNQSSQKIISRCDYPTSKFYFDSWDLLIINLVLLIHIKSLDD